MGEGEVKRSNLRQREEELKGTMMAAAFACRGIASCLDAELEFQHGPFQQRYMHNQ